METDNITTRTFTNCKYPTFEKQTYIGVSIKKLSSTFDFDIHWNCKFVSDNKIDCGVM